MSYLYANENHEVFNALVKTISSICHPEDDCNSTGFTAYYYHGQVDQLFVAQLEEGYDNGWDEDCGGFDFMPTCINLDSEFAKEHQEELSHLILGYLIFEKLNEAGVDKHQVVINCNEIIIEFFEQLN